ARRGIGRTHPAQLPRDVGCALPTRLRILHQRGLNHVLQRWRSQWLERCNRIRLFLQDRRRYSHLALSFERALARGHLVEHRSEAEMSLRASASRPSICSGDMYWNVPMIVPSAVSGWLMCGDVIVTESGDDCAVTSGALLARPKSRILAPKRVSMMLPGFRSR